MMEANLPVTGQCVVAVFCLSSAHDDNVKILLPMSVFAKTKTRNIFLYTVYKFDEEPVLY